MEPNEKAPDRVLCSHEMGGNQIPEQCTQRYMVPLWFYDRNRKMVQARTSWASGFKKDTSITLASTGHLTLSYLLEVVGVKKLHLIGFDHFSKKESGLHHYWLDKTYGRPKEHEGDIESVMFQELAAAGRVAYL